MIVIVPYPEPSPDPGDRSIKTYAKIVTGWDQSARGGYRVQGDIVTPGSEIAAGTGTLILGVSQKTLRWEAGRYGDRYPVQDASLTLWQVGLNGVQTVWSRHFKTASGAWGSTTGNKIQQYLAAASSEVEVLTEAQRPNRKRATCIHCGQEIFPGLGHLVRGSHEAQVEHWQTCPPRLINPGADKLCADCGRSLAPGTGHQVLDRATGQWMVRHKNDECRWAPSYEERKDEQRAQREAEARERKVQADKEEKKRQRAAARAAAKRAKILAEAERVAQLQTVSYGTPAEVNRKQINGGTAVATLCRREDTLSDGTTTIRWVLEIASTYGGWSGEEGAEPDRAEFGDEDSARRAYRTLRWDVDPAPAPRRPTSAAACPGSGVEHCDNCGATEPQGHDGYGLGLQLSWMVASLGTACGPACYDAMADRPGAHARRYHRSRHGS